MSKRVAAAAIILIAFGGVSIPGGFLINNYIKDLTYSSIDEGLLGIRTEGIPLVEHMVNCTICATGISLIVGGALSEFFNDSSYANGIANVSGQGDLSYTGLAAQRILYGNETPSLGHIPGLITDLDQGEGFVEFLELYESAISNPSIRNKMIADYNCSWEYLGYVYNWYFDCGIPVVVPALEPIVPALRPELAGLTNTKEYAEYYLYAQWAWGNLEPQGFPLPLGAIEVYGFEVGYQGPGINVTSTNMTKEAMYKLWNTSNPYSLVSKTGLQKWLAAVDGDTVSYAQLLVENGLSHESMALILKWIPKFQQNVMPYLAQYQMGLPTDSITLGNIIQTAAITLGGVFVGLGGVALVGNVIARRKRISEKQVGKLDKSKSADKGDSEQKYL